MLPIHSKYFKTKWQTVENIVACIEENTFDFKASKFGILSVKMALIPYITTVYRRILLNILLVKYYVLLTVHLDMFVQRKTNLMRNLSLVYFVKKPLHVSGVSTVHHQEVHLCCPGWAQPGKQSSKKSNKYRLLYTYGVLPDDGL